MSKIVPFLLAIVFSLGCGESPKEAVTLANLTTGDVSAVFPLTRGDAYLVADHSSGSVLYYLRAGEATRVLGIAGGLGEFEVHPLADGSAYLTAEEEDSYLLKVYQLSDSRAVPLREVAVISSSNSIGEATSSEFLWALLQKEVAARHSIQKEQGNAEVD